MRVLNLLCSGGTGGVEVLCREYGSHSRLDQRYLMLWREGEISRDMKQRGMQVEVYGTSVKYYLRDLVRFLKKCRQEQIDVLLCHQAAPLIALCVLALKWTQPGVRIIGYAHSDPRDWKKKVRVCRRVIYHCADQVVCISNSVKNSLNSCFLLDKKTVLVYNGIDTRKFAAAARRGGSGELSMICVSRLIPEKGVQNILEGMASLPATAPVRLRIVGDGPYRETLERLCEALGQSSRVEFLGARQDVPELLGQSEVFVHLPAWQEGFGITVAEAMAAGLVCLVNDRGAMPELVTDGVNGYVLGAGTGRDFAGTVTQIYEKLRGHDPEGQLEALRQNARRRAGEFSIERYAETMDRLILTGQAGAKGAQI